MSMYFLWVCVALKFWKWIWRSRRKNRFTHTYLIFPCFSRNKKGAPAFKGTPANELPLHRTSFQTEHSSPSGIESLGFVYSRLTQRGRASHRCSEVRTLTCTKACFRWNREKRRGCLKPCTWSSRVSPVEAMALGRNSWAAESESGILLLRCPPSTHLFGTGPLSMPMTNQGTAQCQPWHLCGSPGNSRPGNAVGLTWRPWESSFQWQFLRSIHSLPQTFMHLLLYTEASGRSLGRLWPHVLFGAWGWWWGELIWRGEGWGGVDWGGLGTLGQNAAQHLYSSMKPGAPYTGLTILSFWGRSHQGSGCPGESDVWDLVCARPSLSQPVCSQQRTSSF